jgi:exopolysaccharide biosynthesis polyprenyl glycosylphosphotransferase
MVIYFIEKINDHTSWGYNILGIISDSPKLRAKFGDRFKFYPDKTHVWLLLEEEAIDELIYARKGFDNEEIKQLIFACEEIGVTFRMRSQLFTMVATKAHLNYFDEIPFLTFTNTPTDYMALLAKSVFDKLFALFAILLSSPVLILLMVLIKLDSKGPIFFIQKRVGLRGRIFGVYKFRTMVVNAEALKDQLMSQNEQQGPVFKMKKDPRITRVGRFLRKTSLDELPQFFNVLFGDMSVVGPRPPVPREVAQYERWQLRRLSMKPGITCIWQVSGRNEISFEEWMRLDLQYIDSWSLKLDVILIIKTIGVVLKADGH